MRILFTLFASITATQAELQYGDRWNYDTTIKRADGFTDYGPPDWGDLSCDESSVAGLEACIGYTDKWIEGQGWSIQDNYCLWCPATDPGSCSQHHESPINLLRNRGLGYWNKTEENNGNPGANADPNAKECIDKHWMKYEDAWCPLDQMIAADSFTIERHAVRINMPITVADDDTVTQNCQVPGKGMRFGRIDFSKGFSQWWYLSHIDIHATSEHTQESKVYDAELQMHHFYSETPDAAGVANEVATVTMFLQAYDNSPPWRYLDKVLCPGCFPYNHGRNLRQNPNSANKKQYSNVVELMLAQQKHAIDAARGVDTPDIPRLLMDKANWDPPEMDEEQSAAFIARESEKFKADEEMWQRLHHEVDNTEKAHEEYHTRHRNLIEGDELDWFLYFPMLGVRTEYYFRYSGSQTIPPCYGHYDSSSRDGTNHWRVMKDPIRIHPRQLEEIKRLIRERIAPQDDPVMACQPDTAAKIVGENVSTARPLQDLNEDHFMVFCECKDWPSKWPEDRAWCKTQDPYARFYDTPYNFRSDGF